MTDFVISTITLFIFRRDVRLPLVLWRNFASNVSNAMQTRRDEALICVLRFGKIKVWKGMYI